MDSKTIWTVVLVSLIVAGIVAFVTVKITGNVIRSYNYKKAPYEVYTKGEVDTKFANINKNLFGVISNCTRTGQEVNTTDPYWQTHLQPTGNSLCSYEGKKCLTSMITKVTIPQGSPPNEWGANTDAGLWPCGWDALSVYGRSSWPIYRMDVICCSI